MEYNYVLSRLFEELNKKADYAPIDDERKKCIKSFLTNRRRLFEEAMTEVFKEYEAKWKEAGIDNLEYHIRRLNDTKNNIEIDINGLIRKREKLEEELEKMNFPDSKSKDAYLLYKHIVETAKGEQERLRAITAAGLIVSASLGMKEVSYSKNTDNLNK